MADRSRYQLLIHGAVQGVGFRPFLFSLSRQLSVTGWVANIPEGVVAEIEGPPELLERFLSRMHSERPRLASIHSCEVTVLDSSGFTDFEIRESLPGIVRGAVIPPDTAVCPDCLREMNDPADRRYRYPFINCTNCGPRFTIISALPYDRPNTSMSRFPMCPDCRREYEDPADRRFHAQPIACPVCGPQMTLKGKDGSTLHHGFEAVQGAAEAIMHGAIVAVKGIGGIHLMADPFSDAAVSLLRTRKLREEKPFALMMPDEAMTGTYCTVSDAERSALTGTAAPIVLLKKRLTSGSVRPVSEAVAPGNPFLGVMLPYAPLHHLLLGLLRQPVIATSGNLTDEPICIDDAEAFDRLGGIADLFLTHDRPILRPADDSIVRIISGREMVMRRGRGFAPLPVVTGLAESVPAIAVGGQMKNTIALCAGPSIIVSQHMGDLETVRSSELFRTTIDDLRTMYAVDPEFIVADTHPDYLSTRYASSTGLPIRSVQHHRAHIFACMAENRVTGPLTGVAWDGTGYGDDGSVWGGEFFTWDGATMQHAATFRPFPLPGSAAAVKEPRRVALGMLYELSGGSVESFSDLPCIASYAEKERQTLCRMMDQKVNTPRTSSAGRIFDAVAALIGVRWRMSYEGQAAMELEALAYQEPGAPAYPFMLQDQNIPYIIDWADMLSAIIADQRNGVPAAMIAARFHKTMSTVIGAVARRLGNDAVLLSGGCFQNALLTEQSIETLRLNGFSPYWHQRIPPNDGGLSVGQLYGAMLMHRISEREKEQAVCA